MKSIFVKEYDPTIEDAYMRPVEVDGALSRLDILDTAGQEEFAALFSQWVKDREGFMLVYSVDNRLSFEKILQIYDLLKLYTEDITRAALILVANKADLPPEMHKVPAEEGEALGKKLGAAMFLETSALSGQNVDNAFHALLRQMRKHRSATQPHVAPAVPLKKMKWCTVL